MPIIRLPAVGLFLLVGLTACSQSFWNRQPRVAGQVQPSMVAPTPAPRAQYAPPPASRLPPPQARPPQARPPAFRQPMPAQVPMGPAGGPAPEERMVLQHVNQIRRSQGLRALAFDDALYACARAHSEEQCRHGYMGHESPDPSRRTLVQRMHLAGYQGQMYGEVVAWGYDDAQSVVEGWMNSSEHRAILVDAEMTEVAFSRVGQYWTGNFGTPRIAPTRRYGPPSHVPPATSAPSRTPAPSRSTYVPSPRSLPAPSVQSAPPPTRTAPPPPSAAVPTYRPPQPRQPVQQYFAPPKPARRPVPTYRPPARGG